MEPKVAETILAQLGGNKFITMTGAKHFVADGNTLRMSIPKNKTKANRLYITLDEGTDTYKMRFFYCKAGRLSLKTGNFIPGTTKEIAEHTNVYAEDLCRVFESVTGMATRLF